MFKVEWSGRGFVGLSAKTYYCYGPDGKQDEKCSAKGINRAVQLTSAHFRSVMDSKKAVSSVNRGFLMKDNVMFTYKMERSGLTYFYCKRKVLSDGMSTTFLDI